MVDQQHVATFRHLFLQHRPQRKARMNEAGHLAKYHTLHYPVSDREIHAHLAARMTLAVPLMGTDETAFAAALDVDHGGVTALWRALVHARRSGLNAFAITSQSDAHTGGHVWFLFDAPVSAVRLRAFAAACAAYAAPGAETYPTRKTLRLPFGLHRGNRRRGQLLLATGDTVDLDRDNAAVLFALQLVGSLPRNQPDQLPQCEIMVPLKRDEQVQHTKPQPDGIQAYNQATNVLTLLQQYGARIALHSADGGALLHCPCPHHAHGDQRPSLVVQPARVPRYGQFVAFGYAPGCLFYTQEGQLLDAFGIRCRLEALASSSASC